MKKSLISYKNVEICQQEQVVLKNVNLEIGEGEFYYLIGKVGTGKSSLIKTMYAELPIESGEAMVLDYDLRRIKRDDIPFLRRQVGIIFQDFQLLTDRSVNENLLFVLRATGWKDKEEMQHRIDEVLKEVGMSTKGYKMPHQLSGGEQQRIVIARALLNKPKLIFADEPTGNLDPQTGSELVELLYNISKNENTTIIMATHNLGWIDAFPGKVLAISQNKLCSGTKDECIFDY